ncbi:MAG: sigma-70 family RNA polymerase sigma factor [Cytophagales bacterium]|nr:sigma-70 family RNA polymerase sigma factor [Cytophagales bacterium]MCA6372294.1 sigma-70 family RNA polymerase sigma factor [Cytophagales bacterium]MCA6382439.1 sigma-70 family RNA polymerase sigma factor [Cytophagales bacterium]
MNYSDEDLKLINQATSKAIQYARAIAKSYRRIDITTQEDVVQDFLVNVLADWDKNKSGLTVNSFIYTSVRNCFSNFLRKSKAFLSCELNERISGKSYNCDLALDLEIVSKAITAPKTKATLVAREIGKGQSLSAVGKKLKVSHRDVVRIANGTYTPAVSKASSFHTLFLQGFNSEDVSEMLNVSKVDAKGQFSYLQKKARRMFPDLVAA